MAITYHAGRRIQGTSTDFAGAPEEGTVVHDFSFSSAPANWNYRIAGSTSHWDNDNSRLNWETKSAGSGSGADYDLGVQTDNWTLRFTIRIDSTQTGYVSAGQGDGVMMFGLQNYTSTSAYTASTPNSANDSTYSESHQMAQMMLLFKSAATEGSGRYRVGGRCETTTTGNWSGAELDVNINDDTDYFIEVKRTSPTTFTISVGSNSDYSTGRTTGTYTVTANSLDGLRYIHFEEHAQNVSYDSYGGGILTDLKFWSGDIEPPANVQVGSRLEETDTRKMSYYESPSVTFEDDFSSSPNGWTLNAYASGQSITGGALVSTVSRSNGYKTLAIGEPTNYVLDFDWKWDNSTRDTPFIILASDITGSTSSTSGYGDPPAGHKRIIFMTANNTGNLYISSRYNNGAAQEENSTLVSGGTAGSYNVKYFYRVVKSGNDVSFKRYLTDANRTAGASLQQETNLTMNNTNYTATADYAYLEVGAHGFYGQNTLYDFKFYSGVTSPDTVWSELGT